MNAAPPVHYTFGNHFHFVDMEWLWGYGVLGASLRDMLEFQRRTGARGNLNFDGVGYERMAAEEPEALDLLATAVSENQLEIVGASYGQPYALFHGGESAIRQLQHGLAAAERLTGRRPTAFWEEEFFFFPQLPQILVSLGYSAASLFFQWTWHTPEIPFETAPAIRWAGPDGTSILTLPRNSLTLHQWPEDFAQVAEDPLLRESPAPVIQQWLELLPSPDWMCRAELLIDGYESLTRIGSLVPGTLSEVVDRVKEFAVDRCYGMDDVFHGTSIGKNGDAHHRRSAALEALLLTAESIATVASTLGRPYVRWGAYPTWELDEAWRELLAFQHHDNDECEGLCGHVGIAGAKRANHMVTNVIDTTLAHLSSRSEAQRGQIVAYNALGWKRADIIADAVGTRRLVELDPFSVTVVDDRHQAEEAINVEFHESTVTLQYRNQRARIDLAAATLIELEVDGSARSRSSSIGQLRTIVDGKGSCGVVTGHRSIERGVQFDVTIASASGHVNYVMVPAGLVVEVHFDAIDPPDPTSLASLSIRVCDDDLDKFITDSPYSFHSIRANRVDQRKYPTADWMTSPQVFETVSGQFTALSAVDFRHQDHQMLVVHDGSQGFRRHCDGVEAILSMNDPWDENYFDPRCNARFLLVLHDDISNAERRRIAENFRRPPIVAKASGRGSHHLQNSACVRLTDDASSVTIESLHRLDAYLASGFADSVVHQVNLPIVARLVEWNGIDDPVELEVSDEVVRAWETTPDGAVIAPLSVKTRVDGKSVSIVTVPVRAYGIHTVALDIPTAEPTSRNLDSHRDVWAAVHRVDTEREDHD